MGAPESKKLFETYSGTQADFMRIVSLLDKDLAEFEEADRAMFLQLEFRILQLIQKPWPIDGPDIATVLMREINAMPLDVEPNDDVFCDAVLKGLVPFLSFSASRLSKLSPEEFQRYCRRALG